MKLELFKRNNGEKMARRELDDEYLARVQEITDTLKRATDTIKVFELSGDEKAFIKKTAMGIVKLVLNDFEIASEEVLRAEWAKQDATWDCQPPKAIYPRPLSMSVCVAVALSLIEAIRISMDANDWRKPELD
jgi:hypothetical protein